MATKLDDLLAEALRLPPQDRQHLLEALKAAQVAEADTVSDGETTNPGDSNAPHQQRRLVRKNGYLVVEALPGEKPITTEEVKKILDDMEW